MSDNAMLWLGWCHAGLARFARASSSDVTTSATPDLQPPVAAEGSDQYLAVPSSKTGNLSQTAPGENI